MANDNGAPESGLRLFGRRKRQLAPKVKLAPGPAAIPSEQVEPRDQLQIPERRDGAGGVKIDGLDARINMSELDKNLTLFPDAPRTFRGENLQERTFMGYGTDGSMIAYVRAMAHKANFEYRMSSPADNMLSAWLSALTTRTWTLNLVSGRDYMNAFVAWLGLDWKGYRFYQGGTFNIFTASPRAASSVAKETVTSATPVQEIQPE